MLNQGLCRKWFVLACLSQQESKPSSSPISNEFRERLGGGFNLGMHRISQL